MKHSRVQVLGAAVLALAVGAVARGQSSPTISGPAGDYKISLAAAGTLPQWVGIVTGPAGTYTVIVPDGMIPTITRTDTSFTISWGSTPTPPPPPPPSAVDHYYVLWTWDKAVPLTTAQQAIQNSVSIASSLRTLNAIWAAADSSSPVISAWVPDKSKVAFPALVVIGVDKAGHGTVLPGGSITSPADEAGIVATVKSLTGGK